MSLWRNKKILILDGDEGLALATRRLLEDEGYIVVTHGSAEGVVEIAQRERPDLVVLDVDMPGLSRRGLLEALSRHPDIRVPVVLYSSGDPRRLTADVVRHGLAGFIPKGSRLELRARVATYLRLAAAPP